MRDDTTGPSRYVIARRLAAIRYSGDSHARRRGSHIILTKPGHIATLCVPHHTEVARGTLRTLIARAGLTIDEFLRALEN